MDFLETKTLKTSSLAADEERKEDMVRKATLLGLCVIFLATATFAFAETVYITPNGTKYHKEECRFIKNKDAQKMEKTEAVAAGYEPCSRCFKEDVSAVESQKIDQDVSRIEEKTTQDKS